MKIGFSNEKYLKEQKEYIMERVSKFQKLYLEFGGKLFNDRHAARVLPGYDENIKTKLLEELKDRSEVIIAIRAADIESNKLNNNSGTTYERESLRLIDQLREKGISINSVVINRYYPQENVDHFIALLNARGIRTYTHGDTLGYPNDVDTILSEEGFGKHSYIETTKPIVVVTAPGPGSGKMSTCLSQLYHENKRGVKAGYAKFETFPVWNLPLKHEVNLAYEAATADLNDVNQIDPYHLEAYNKVAVNYNRDVESFIILKRILDRIMGSDIYRSPTDMGVNRITYGITDEEIVKEAAKQEIIRRFLVAQYEYKKIQQDDSELERLRRLMDELMLKPEDRKSVKVAREKRDELIAQGFLDRNVTAIESEDGAIITGKDSLLMDSCAAAVLNMLKHLSGLPDELHMIDPAVLNPILDMKKDIEQDAKTQLNLEEVLICLATSKLYNPSAKICIDHLMKLRGLRGHTTGILPSIDYELLRKLNLDMTSDYEDGSGKVFQ
ncbi:MAG: DUF1846 family protein [Tissierellia bacterium]|nr:DUF1846 family protein [Tissierellia bacterium]